MRTDPQTVDLSLNKAEAEIVSEALGHVWRDVMDRRRDYKGSVLRKVLDRLNTITDARR